jgi:hypothetical protein
VLSPAPGKRQLLPDVAEEPTERDDDGVLDGDDNDVFDSGDNVLDSDVYCLCEWKNAALSGRRCRSYPPSLPTH